MNRLDIDWTKKDAIKQHFLFAKPTNTLLYDKINKKKLIAEMDLFNNHIEFLVTDETGDFVSASSFDLFEAIDMFYSE